jgi:hypothetical protein
MGRPGSGITDSAVEAQAQAMISQPQRVSCAGTAIWNNGTITVQGVIPFGHHNPNRPCSRSPAGPAVSRA